MSERSELYSTFKTYVGLRDVNILRLPCFREANITLRIFPIKVDNTATNMMHPLTSCSGYKHEIDYDVHV